MELKEQVAYLRGLIEGQEFPEEREEVLWTQLLNVCDLISIEIENMRDDQEELNEYVEEFNCDKDKQDKIEKYSLEDLNKIAFWNATGERVII
ncbi:MAG TPA: hypothetical protein DDW93_04665, partial [Firmicutes bacterium]|nr:hypothetical protein [Bacillota bacterium]